MQTKFAAYYEKWVERKVLLNHAAGVKANYEVVMDGFFQGEEFLRRCVIAVSPIVYEKSQLISLSAVAHC